MDCGGLGRQKVTDALKKHDILPSEALPSQTAHFVSFDAKIPRPRRVNMRLLPFLLLTASAVQAEDLAADADADADAASTNTPFQIPAVNIGEQLNDMVKAVTNAIKMSPIRPVVPPNFHDRFCYYETNLEENIFGPADWGQVHCSNVEDCPGWVSLMFALLKSLPHVFYFRH